MIERLAGKFKKIEVITMGDLRFALRYNNTAVAKLLNMNRGTCQRASDEMIIRIKRDDHGSIIFMQPMKDY